MPNILDNELLRIEVKGDFLERLEKIFRLVDSNTIALAKAVDKIHKKVKDIRRMLKENEGEEEDQEDTTQIQATPPETENTPVEYTPINNNPVEPTDEIQFEDFTVREEVPDDINWDPIIENIDEDGPPQREMPFANPPISNPPNALARQIPGNNGRGKDPADYRVPIERNRKRLLVGEGSKQIEPAPKRQRGNQLPEIFRGNKKTHNQILNIPTITIPTANQSSADTLPDEDHGDKDNANTRTIRGYLDSIGSVKAYYTPAQALGKEFWSTVDKVKSRRELGESDQIIGRDEYHAYLDPQSEKDFGPIKLSEMVTLFSSDEDMFPASQRAEFIPAYISMVAKPALPVSIQIFDSLTSVPNAFNQSEIVLVLYQEFEKNTINFIFVDNTDKTATIVRWEAKMATGKKSKALVSEILEYIPDISEDETHEKVFGFKNTTPIRSIYLMILFASVVTRFYKHGTSFEEYADLFMESLTRRVNANGNPELENTRDLRSLLVRYFYIVFMTKNVDTREKAPRGRNGGDRIKTKRQQQAYIDERIFPERENMTQKQVREHKAMIERMRRQTIETSKDRGGTQLPAEFREPGLPPNPRSFREPDLLINR